MDEGAAPVLRLYRWSRPTLTLGYRQQPNDWLERARGAGFDVARRASGGGSVVHAGDLTYSVIAPSGSLNGIPARPYASYRFIRSVLVDALQSLGICVDPADAADRAVRDLAESQAAREPICFRASTGAEIEVNGVKRIGNAHRRCRWGFLQHGSIRLRDDSDQYRALGLDAPAWPAAERAWTGSVVADAVVKAFEAATGRSLDASNLTRHERQRATLRSQQRTRSSLISPQLARRW